MYPVKPISKGNDQHTSHLKPLRVKGTHRGKRNPANFKATRYIKEFRSFRGLVNYDRKLLRQHLWDDSAVIAFIKQGKSLEIQFPGGGASEMWKRMS